MKLIIAEKPSVGKEIAHIVGANQSHEGYLEGNLEDMLKERKNN